MKRHTQRGFYFAGQNRPKRLLPTMAELDAGLRRAEERLGIVRPKRNRMIDRTRRRRLADPEPAKAEDVDAI